ncbi:MAG: sarcosine oxidase subunit gamma [Kiloniellales bacterium]
MTETYLQQSPLAHLGLLARVQDGRGEAGVTLAERRFQGIVDLRGDASDPAFMAAVESMLGFVLPTTACTAAGEGTSGALWIGPNEWWVIMPPDDQSGDGPASAERLRQALAGQHAAVTDISDSRACIRVSGPRARDLLAKGCPLDLHPRVFGPGRCAGSLLAKAVVVLHQTSGAAGDEGADDPTFDIYVARSFAEYLWHWLEDAAREYGLAVVEA